jgi:hypothetical protein
MKKINELKYNSFKLTKERKIDCQKPAEGQNTDKKSL